MRQIVILGAGTAGTMMLNKLNDVPNKNIKCALTSS